MSEDPKINMITDCWRYLRHVRHPLVPNGASPPKLPILIATIADINGFREQLVEIDDRDDQLLFVHGFIVENNLPHHKLTKAETRERRQKKPKSNALPPLTKHEKARQKEPFMPSGPPPAMASVPVKLTGEGKQKKRAERRARVAAANLVKQEEKARVKAMKRSDRYQWVISDAFLKSYEWRKVRYAVVVRCKGRCEACGAGKEKDIVLHVDHIKSRRRYPELALKPSNLQGLCEPCNHGKGNWDETDWRPDEVRANCLDEEADRELDEAYRRAMGSA